LARSSASPDIEDAEEAGKTGVKVGAEPVAAESVESDETNGRSNGTPLP
jgi:hypothetical protein